VADVFYLSTGFLSRLCSLTSFMLMSDRMHTGLVVAISLLVLYAGLCILSVQVSMKYETGIDPCYSVVSGRNLCTDYEWMKWLTGAVVVLLLLIIVFSNHLIRKR
jgi:hypothetical protein